MRSSREGKHAAKLLVRVVWFLTVVLGGMQAPGWADPGGDAESPGRRHVPKEIVGRWHAKSIHGHELFLVIHGLQITVYEDGRFIATVIFAERTHESLKGTCWVESDKLYFKCKKGTGNVSYHMEREGAVLVVHDREFDVTLKLRRSNP